MRPTSLTRSSLIALALGCFAFSSTASAQNQSATFNNNVDGYIEIAYNDTVIPRTGITVEAWVKYDESTLPIGWRFPTIVRQNPNAGLESYFLRIESADTKNTSVRWLVNTQNNGPVSVEWNFGSGGLLQWTHLAGTYDGSQVKLYASGVLVASTSASGPLKNNGDVLRIGKGSDVGSPMEVFNGSIDEFRLWPFARTIEEINETKKRALSNVPGVVSTWSLDGHALDVSGGNSGTMSGTINFTPPAPALITQVFAGASFGTSTPGCNGDLRASIGSCPTVGNLAFSMVAHPVPTGFPVFCYIGQSLMSTPLNLAGIDVWVNPVTAIGLYPATVDALGVARMNVPLSITLPAGIPVTFQFAAVDPCGSQGFTASDAIGFVTMAKVLTPFP